MARGLGWPVSIALALVALGYGLPIRLPIEGLLLGVAALLVAMWAVSRRMLGRRVAWLRTAMRRAGEGELGVRLAAKGEPAWDAIAEAFNSTMANIERERERLVRR
ncbi:MAG: hypothetical protein AB7I32_17400, partial [Gammaproteobacteria bacterium]